jgi:hypothetical protein
MIPEKTEREKYIERLENELSKAAKAQAFINSESGKYVLDYISELVSQLTNNIINKRRTHEEYIEIRAKIDILRKLKQVLEVQSNESIIADLSSQLELAQSE